MFNLYRMQKKYQLYNINNNDPNLRSIYLVGIFVLCSQTNLYEQQWVSVPHLLSEVREGTVNEKRDEEYEESSLSSLQKRQEHKQSIYTFSARIRYLLHEQVFCQPHGSVSSGKQLSGPALEAASILRVTT